MFDPGRQRLLEQTLTTGTVQRTPNFARNADDENSEKLSNSACDLSQIEETDRNDLLTAERSISYSQELREVIRWTICAYPDQNHGVYNKPILKSLRIQLSNQQSQTRDALLAQRVSRLEYSSYERT